MRRHRVDPAARMLVAHLRAHGIADPLVLAAIERIPREEFLPPPLRRDAYLDQALPIASGQTISQPFVVAYMTEALEVRCWHRVLEVGTGSGYQAAVLSRICRQVCTIERYLDLYHSAVATFTRLGLKNIVARHGDGFEGWAAAETGTKETFERIVVTAAPTEVPQALLDQLAEGGVMVLPLGRTLEDQRLLRIRRLEGRPVMESLLAVRFVPMLAGRV